VVLTLLRVIALGLLFEGGQLVLMLVNILCYLEEVVSDVFESLHIGANGSHGCVDLAEGLKHEVLALVLQHGHHFGAVHVVLLLVLLLGQL